MNNVRSSIASQESLAEKGFEYIRKDAERSDVLGKSAAEQFLFTSSGNLDPQGALRTQQLGKVWNATEVHAESIPGLLTDLRESEEMKEVLQGVKDALRDKEHPAFQQDHLGLRPEIDAMLKGLMHAPAKGATDAGRYLRARGDYVVPNGEAIAKDLQWIREKEDLPGLSPSEQSVLANLEKGLLRYEGTVLGGNALSDSIINATKDPNFRSVVDRTNKGFRLGFFMLGMVGVILNFLVGIRTKNYKSMVPWALLAAFAAYGGKLLEPEEKAIARELAPLKPGGSFDALLQEERYALKDHWKSWSKVNEKIWNNNEDIQSIMKVAPKQALLAAKKQEILQKFPQDIQEQAWAMLTDGRFPEYVQAMRGINSEKLQKYLSGMYA